SGYTKDELKNMSLSQLEFEKDTKDKLDKAWLDNGICRYEESWRNKNGSIIFLDMSAKWIQFSNYRLILYIARDIQRKKESNMKDKIKDFQSYQKNKLIEITSIHQGYNKHVLRLVSSTMKKIVDLEKHDPETFQHFSDLLSEWKETQKILEMLSLKNSRDLNTSPIQWNLNDMIMQELYCLELLNDSKDFIARTSLDSKIPMVFGAGQDFSIIFGFIFQAIFESINELNEKEIHILTRCMDDEVFVEIRTNKPVHFEENMAKEINPFFQPDNLITTDEVEKEFSFCQIFIESFGMKISVSHNEKTVIRIMVPTTETNKNQRNEAIIDYSTNSAMYR
ncbi:PAS domain-containing protein, partial [bacterium]|nr:PAS domain-containing protein [bacterium]